MVLDPEKRGEAEAIFRRWGLDFATVGETTESLRFEVFLGGAKVADMPIKALGDEAPEYDRPWSVPSPPAELDAHGLDGVDPGEALLRMIGSPALSSRRWVWEQYDTFIQGNSIQRPGGDAGVIRIARPDGSPTSRGLAMSSDVTPRYCEADPYLGGMQAVAECWRNITATGAQPLAATDNLNFGNPERPDSYGQFVRAVEGIGEACRVLSFPIVSGNVSLYNETQGRAILPTPTIAGIGLIEDWRRACGLAFRAEGEAILLIGGPADWGSHLGQSTYLSEIFGREDGAPPPVDLDEEKRIGDAVRRAIGDGMVSACHDCSDGGLAVSLAEMAMASGLGAAVDIPPGPIHATLFGEDQARYVLSCSRDDASRILESCAEEGVAARIIGTVEGTALRIGDALSIPVDTLRTAHEAWLPRYMDGS